jgi:TRAP-type C4-dicarboxylate transport system permease small subunit
MSKQATDKQDSGLLNVIDRLCLGVATVCMLFMALVVVINVVGRYFFHSPLPATIEIVGLGAAVLISLSLFPSQLHNRNISVPIIVEKLGPRVLRVFSVCSLALSLCIVGILTWTGAGYAWEMLFRFERTSVLRVPLAPFRFIWALGCVLIFLILAIQFVRLLQRGGK